ncbi:hypothetical protein GCM10009743_60000 [Kribbella swartbergensis]
MIAAADSRGGLTGSASAGRAATDKAATAANAAVRRRVEDRMSQAFRDKPCANRPWQLQDIKRLDGESKRP